jgi:hypothetical protein
MSFPISSKIPLPPRANSTGRYPLRALQIGESFFVPAKDAGEEGRTLYQAASNFRVRFKSTHRFSIRKVKGGFRAWRVAV